MGPTETAKPRHGSFNLPQDQIEAFARRWQLKEFAIFGSALRDDFTAASDVDVLVTFLPEARPSLFHLGRMQQELEEIFGRRVDLLERGGVEEGRNPYLRNEILNTARIVYAR